MKSLFGMISKRTSSKKVYKAEHVVTGLAYPHGIVKAKDGSFFVEDQNNNQIKQLVPNSHGGFDVKTVAGSSAGYKDGRCDQAKLNFIGSLALDDEENLYVCDTDNSCVRKVTRYGIVETLVPTNFEFDGKAMMINKNRPMTIDKQKTHIYFADSTGTLYKINLHTKKCVAKFSIEKTEHNLPRGLVFDKDDNLYFTTDKEVKKMDMKTLSSEVVCNVPDGKSLTIDTANRFLYIGTTKMLGRINLRTKELESMIEMDWVTGLALDGKGNLFLSDYTGGAIRKVVLVRILEWEKERLIWIGHSKNNPKSCPFARLPKDMVKEILAFCTDY